MNGFGTGDSLEPPRVSGTMIPAAYKTHIRRGI